MKHVLQQSTEHPNEQRILLVRRHWYHFLRHIIVLLVIGLVPVALAVLWGQPVADALAERSAGGVLLVMGVSLVYLFLLLSFLHAWVDYYLDFWIVSNRRIVNIEQHGLFSRVMSELYLDKVQDVTVEVHGPLATMLRFGDVHIQTAGENPRFLFDDVPEPYKIAQTIMELHRAFPASDGTAPPQTQNQPVSPTDPVMKG